MVTLLLLRPDHKNWQYQVWPFFFTFWTYGIYQSINSHLLLTILFCRTIYYGASIMIYLKWPCSELSCSLCWIRQKYIKEKLYADHKKSIEQSIKYFIAVCRHFKTLFLLYFVCVFFAVGYHKTGWSAIE